MARETYPIATVGGEGKSRFVAPSLMHKSRYSGLMMLELRSRGGLGNCRRRKYLSDSSPGQVCRICAKDSDLTSAEGAIEQPVCLYLSLNESKDHRDVLAILRLLGYWRS